MEAGSLGILVGWSCVCLVCCMAGVDKRLAPFVDDREPCGLSGCIVIQSAVFGMWYSIMVPVVLMTGHLECAAILAMLPILGSSFLFLPLIPPFLLLFWASPILLMWNILAGFPERGFRGDGCATTPHRSPRGAPGHYHRVLERRPASRPE